MSESQQKKISRVRPPRVHITYDVEIGDAWVKRELPFVMGVIGDFSGNPTEKLKPLKDRNFIQIDRDNFDEVMARMTPGLSYQVDNTLAGDGSEMKVQLKFSKLTDFEPANVAKQVEPLRKLLDARNNLRDLMSKIQTRDDLEAILNNVLQNTEELQSFASELGVEAADAKPGDANAGDAKPDEANADQPNDEKGEE